MADIPRDTPPTRPREPYRGKDPHSDPNYVGAAKWGAWIMGVILLLLSILGFFGGDHILGVFGTNALHNLVYLISGLVLVGMGFATEAAARTTHWVFAIVFGLLAILGFLGVPAIVDVFNMNESNHWLHLLFTAVFVVGALTSQYQERARLHPARSPERRV